MYSFFFSGFEGSRRGDPAVAPRWPRGGPAVAPWWPRGGTVVAPWWRWRWGRAGGVPRSRSGGGAKMFKYIFVALVHW